MPKGIYEGNKGKKLSDENKKRISECLKKSWREDKRKGGWKLSEKGIINLSKRMKGKKIALGKYWKLSDETKRKMSLSKKGNMGFRGEKNGNWKGGVSINRHNSNWRCKIWRLKIFERDNWTCQFCGKSNCYLEAHHIRSWINFPKLRYKLNNGLTLCKECHKLTNNYKGRAIKSLT